MSREDLDPFISGIMQTQLETNNIAGAVVAVVKDGEIIFAKGYGYADVKSHTPVSVDDTLFRIGSISKLFTWTAVMQQVELGKIDLDTDINQYLDFHIPDAFGKPATMRQLMTHTAGFEETIQGMLLTNPARLTSLHDYLVNHIPARIFIPGTVSAYSNYGAALAGYIVQRVTGESFSSYVQRHITDPLKMRHSSFAQPLPESLTAIMSRGYDSASQAARPYELIAPAPAGSMAASASDMARFMIAYLQNGTLEGASVLKPETVVLMQSRQFAFDPRENAMGLGFYEESRNGQRIVGHGGDTMYFHSDLHLIPAAHIGFFVSYNSNGNGAVNGRAALFGKFMNRYFPVQLTPAHAIPSASADAQAISHHYLASRRSESNMSYVAQVFGHTRVSAEDDGSITVEDFNGPDKRPLHWVETAPGYWEDTNGLQRHLIFRRAADGRWEFSSGFPATIFQQSTATQNGQLNTVLLAAAISSFLASLLLWPAAYLVRRHYRSPRPDKHEQRVRIGIRLVCGLQLLYFAGGIGYLGVSGMSGIMEAGFDTALGVITVIGWIAAASSVAGVWFAYRAWRTNGLWWGTRVHRTLIALACIVATTLALYSHMLTTHIAY